MFHFLNIFLLTRLSFLVHETTLNFICELLNIRYIIDSIRGSCYMMKFFSVLGIVKPRFFFHGITKKKLMHDELFTNCMIIFFNYIFLCILWKNFFCLCVSLLNCKKTVSQNSCRISYESFKTPENVHLGFGFSNFSFR